jgi:uncharacterized protein (DUF433 family)
MNIKEVVDDVIECEKPLFYKSKLMGSCSDFAHPHLSSWALPVTAFTAPKKKVSFKEKIQEILQQCCAEHPAISTEPGIFGGTPHLDRIRLAVGDVLAQLYVLGSIQSVVDYYAPDINEFQIKEALAFAQDFLEMACDPHQTHD